MGCKERRVNRKRSFLQQRPKSSNRCGSVDVRYPDPTGVEPGAAVLFPVIDENVARCGVTVLVLGGAGDDADGRTAEAGNPGALLLRRLGDRGRDTGQDGWAVGCREIG